MQKRNAEKSAEWPNELFRAFCARDFEIRSASAAQQQQQQPYAKKVIPKLWRCSVANEDHYLQICYPC
jgi:hypothetical protein